jgi:hypothetical protein
MRFVCFIFTIFLCSRLIHEETIYDNLFYLIELS